MAVGGSIVIGSLTTISDSASGTMTAQHTRISWGGHLRHDGHVLCAVDLDGEGLVSHIALLLIIGLDIYFDVVGDRVVDRGGGGVDGGRVGDIVGWMGGAVEFCCEQVVVAGERRVGHVEDRGGDRRVTVTGE